MPSDPGMQLSPFVSSQYCSASKKSVDLWVTFIFSSFKKVKCLRKDNDDLFLLLLEMLAIVGLIEEF